MALAAAVFANHTNYEKIDCQKEMTHPLSMDSQSSSIGSEVCLLAGCGFGLTSVGYSGVVTVGLEPGSGCAAACDGGTRAVSACSSVGAIG